MSKKKVQLSDINWGNAQTGSLAGQESHLGLSREGMIILSSVGGSSITTPASSTDNAIVRFSGTGGSTIQDSSATISDAGILSASAMTVSSITVGALSGSGLIRGHALSGSSVKGHLVSGSSATFHEAIITRLSASSIHIGTNDAGADRQITFGDTGTSKTVIGVDNSLNEFVIYRNKSLIPSSLPSAGPDFTIQSSEVNIGNGNALRIGGEASATDGTDRIISFNHATAPTYMGIDDSQDAFVISIGGAFASTNAFELHTSGEIQLGKGKLQVDGTGGGYTNGTYGGTNTLGLFHDASDGNNGIMITRVDHSTSDGDLLGGIGFDSTDWKSPSSILEASAFIAAYAAEAHGAEDKGGDLVFGTSMINDDDDTASHEWMRITHEGRVGIGVSGSSAGTPDNRLHVSSPNGTGKSTMKLEQLDPEEPFIHFSGSTASDQTKSLSTDTSVGALTGHVRVSINGTDYWIPYYAAN
jgi:hypothetical protein